MPNFQHSLEDLHLTRPTLLLDKNRVMGNIRRMKEKADQVILPIHSCLPPTCTGSI